MNELRQIISDEVMKLIDSGLSPEEAVLQVGFQHFLITPDEAEMIRSGQLGREEKQDLLDRAQGIVRDPQRDLEELRSARELHPLYKADFTEAELEKLKTYAPAEYELLY